jgi:hypothetical protein
MNRKGHKLEALEMGEIVVTKYALQNLQNRSGALWLNVEKYIT